MLVAFYRRHWQALCAVWALTLVLFLYLPSGVKPVDSTSVSQESVRLPVVMYHGVQKGAKHVGPYVVSVAQLEADFAAYQAAGYETVVVSDLVDYVRFGTKLPPKPLMITFDDGQLAVLAYALPLLKQYGLRAVVSVVGAYADMAEAQSDPNPQYAYLTWQDIRTLADSGFVEIQNHSYDMHALSARRGSGRKQGETAAQYEAAFRGDLTRMQEQLLKRAGVTATAFAYPFGLISEQAPGLLRDMGFEAALSCEERVNRITRDPDTLYHLGRFNRSGLVTTDSFLRKLATD